MGFFWEHTATTDICALSLRETLPVSVIVKPSGVLPEVVLADHPFDEIGWGG